MNLNKKYNNNYDDVVFKNERGQLLLLMEVET